MICSNLPFFPDVIGAQGSSSEAASFWSGIRATDQSRFFAVVSAELS
jgi:hypothetical protein